MEYGLFSYQNQGFRSFRIKMEEQAKVQDQAKNKTHKSQKMVHTLKNTKFGTR